jgi:hypothetical protein
VFLCHSVSLLLLLLLLLLFVWGDTSRFMRAPSPHPPRKPPSPSSFPARHLRPRPLFSQPPPPPPGPCQPVFEGDTEKKQASASKAMNDAVAKYALGIQDRLDALASSLLQPRQLVSSTGQVPRNYPATNPLQDILRHWNPDVIEVPAGFKNEGTLRVFDYAVGGQRRSACVWDGGGALGGWRSCAAVCRVCVGWGGAVGGWMSCAAVCRVCV